MRTKISANSSRLYVRRCVPGEAAREAAEHEGLKAIAEDCLTKFHGHHFLSFAAT